MVMISIEHVSVYLCHGSPSCFLYAISSRGAGHRVQDGACKLYSIQPSRFQYKNYFRSSIWWNMSDKQKCLSLTLVPLTSSPLATIPALLSTSDKVSAANIDREWQSRKMLKIEPYFLSIRSTLPTHFSFSWLQCVLLFVKGNQCPLTEWQNSEVLDTCRMLLGWRRLRIKNRRVGDSSAAMIWSFVMVARYLMQTFSHGHWLLICPIASKTAGIIYHKTERVVGDNIEEWGFEWRV